LRITASNILFSTESVRSYSECNILSDETMGQSFTIAAGPRQRSHSQIQIPRTSWPYFSVSDSRLPQPGGPGPRIYIPQEQGGPVVPPQALGSLFVASYDSQGYGGRILTCLHTGMNEWMKYVSLF
jgi:hypothetical protein